MNTIYKKILALVLSLALVSCGQDLTSVEHVAKAKDFVAEDDYASASLELLNAASKNPDNLEARWLLGKVALELGDANRAVRELQRALKLGMNYSEIQPSLVRAFLLQGDLDSVIKEATYLAEGMPVKDQATVLAYLGHAFLGKQETDKAREVLAAAINKDPSVVPVLLGKASLSALNGDREEAMEWVVKAQTADASVPEIWSVMGDLEFDSGRYQLAQKAYSEAIRLRRFEQLDRAKRALVEIKLGSFENAKTDVDALKKSRYKDYWYVNYVMGRLQFDQGLFRAAADTFDAVLNDEPRNLETMFYAAVAHSRLGNHQQALSLVDKIAYELPNSLTAKRLAGEILANKGDFSQALKVLKESELTDANNPALLRLLGMVSFQEGNHQESVKYFEKLVSLDPNLPQVQEMLMLARLILGEDLQVQRGYLALEGGDERHEYNKQLLLAFSEFNQKRPQAARSIAEKLHEKYPEEVAPLNMISATYLAVGDWAQARTALNEVLSLSDTDLAALMNLTRLELIEKNRDNAQRLLGKLLEVHSHNANAILFAHDVKVSLGDSVSATQVLESALTKVLPNDLVRVKLMQQYFANKRYDDAIGLTESLTEEQFEAMPVLLQLAGMSYIRKGAHDKATMLFSKWARLKPASYLAHFNYAEVLVAQGDIQGAMLEYFKAASLVPANIDIAGSYITLLAQAGHLDEAEKVLADAIQRQGNQPHLVEFEGWLAMLRGDYSFAQQKLELSRDYKKTSGNTIRLVRTLTYQEKENEAHALLDSWLANHQNDRDVLLHKAGLYLAQDREVDAAKVYADVLKYFPDHIPSLNNLAWLSRDQDIHYAIDIAEKAHKLDSRDPFVLDTLGTLRVMAGNISQGLVSLRKASVIAPGDFQIKLHLAKALLVADQKAEAREVVAIIVSQSPGSEWADQATRLLLNGE